MRQAERQAERAYFEARVMEPSDGCRLWPFGHHGGGYGILGDIGLVHSATCERWHGPRPSGLVAAHSCGNRGCWAGEHLRWTSARGNRTDQHAHGTWGWRLTECDVLAIRRLSAEGVPYSALASEFGTSKSNVSFIVRRETWQHV